MSNMVIPNIKTIILCGGAGTRMKEETEFKPKPMVLIGEKPMLWHITKDFKNKFNYQGGVMIPLSNSPYVKEEI